MIITSNERLFGYARVSTTDQELNLQVDALLAHGVEKQRLYCDKISGTREDRPGLAACNEALGVVTRLSSGALIDLDDRCAIW